MKNEQRILKIADELERQQKDVTYLDATIYNNLQLSKAMFYRLKPKALQELRKRTEFKRSLINEATAHEIEESVRNGLKSDLEIELQLCKIAFAELDVIETTSTPDGMIDFHRKPTPSEMIQAIKD